MDDLKRLYKGRWFRQRKSLAWRIPIVCDAILSALQLKPKTLIDLGCGNGDLVSGFLERGIDAYGVEGTTNCLDYTMIPEGRLTIKDLRLPIVFTEKFDLCLCFEVAEHIEPYAADTLIDTICKASDQVLFTAAGLGQGGTHHVNCQPKYYWITKFYKRGYKIYFPVMNIIKEELEKSKKHLTKGIKAYYHNIMYFENSKRKK